MRLAFFFAAITLGACGGDSFSGNADAAADQDAAETSDSETADVGVQSDACAKPASFYLDSDHDGWGGTSTVLACDPPSSDYVTKGGDCDDGNDKVHPNQTQFFDTAYTPTGKTDPSFDYDCDGKESEAGSSPQANCAVVTLSCVGSGYLPASPLRSGVGVDPYCGSGLEVTCAYVSLVCKAGTPMVTSPIVCH